MWSFPCEPFFPHTHWQLSHWTNKYIKDRQLVLQFSGRLSLSTQWQSGHLCLRSALKVFACILAVHLAVSSRTLALKDHLPLLCGCLLWISSYRPLLLLCLPIHNQPGCSPPVTCLELSCRLSTQPALAKLLRFSPSWGLSYRFANFLYLKWNQFNCDLCSQCGLWVLPV